MAAPFGNTNGTKAKPWTDAIRRAIARYDTSSKEDGKFLNSLADQLLIDCLNGDLQAFIELTNRLDGKPAQATTVSGDPDYPLQLSLNVSFK